MFRNEWSISSFSFSFSDSVEIGSWQANVIVSSHGSENVQPNVVPRPRIILILFKFSSINFYFSILFFIFYLFAISNIHVYEKMRSCPFHVCPYSWRFVHFNCYFNENMFLLEKRIKIKNKNLIRSNVFRCFWIVSKL